MENQIIYLINIITRTQKKLNKTIKIKNINSKKSIDILNKIDFDYLLSINNTQIFKKSISSNI